MEIINKEQLASYLLLRPSTVQTYAKNGRWDMIPPPIKVGGRNRWDKEKVDDWLRDRQVGSKAESRRNA